MSRAAHLLLWGLVACAQTPQKTPRMEPDAPDIPTDDTPTEICNGVDDDGDGDVDEGFTPATWYPDRDGDGVGATGSAIESCFQPEGTVTRSGDCDDDNPAIFPGQTERCNDIDDNCDDIVDGPTSVDAVLRFPDEDGDGYGQAAQTVCPDDVDDGWLETSAGLDCDDTDPTVHPDATEACNGIDDDCDPSTDEDGSLRFIDFTGAVYDWGAGVLTGSVGFVRPGTVQFCQGTHPMTLRARAELTIEAAPAATDRPTITGAPHGGPALMLRDPDLHVTVAGIDLEGGLGTAAILGEGIGGGAVECDTNGTLALSDVQITGGYADVGGAILVRGGCALTGSNVVVQRAEAAWTGGLLAILHGSVVFNDSELSAGRSPVGGGASVVGWDGSAALTLDNTSIRGCTGERLGGGLYIEAASVTCLGDPTAGTGIHSNSGFEGGGAWMAPGATFDGSDCEMGSGTTDNLIHDVAWDDLGTWGASWNGPATFACTDGGCE